jgi:uncharacterized protein (DUF1778 family)
MRMREIVLTFRVTKHERELLNELARAQQRSRSEFIRQLVYKHAQEEVRDEQRQRQ